MTIALEGFFNGAPAVRASAPGRVNLLGEHTDYNDGFMLPSATPQRTEVALSLSRGDYYDMYSATLGQRVRFARGEAAPPGFGRYIEGCIRLLEEHSGALAPVRVYVRSDVPVGAGLSSSAALELATLRALRTLFGLPLDDVALALLGQQAEQRYAQVRCGIMDQLAASLADSAHMLFIDARTLEHALLAMPSGTALIVIDSGVARTLAASQYNRRRAECEQAARLLGVPALRDISDVDMLDGLPEPYRKRARHVVRENLRVLQACTGLDAAQFGRLMNHSHASLRDDFEVSIDALDELTALLRATPGVFGARLTGAGFGGACVALCRRDAAGAAGDAVVRRFNAAPGRCARLLIPASDRLDVGQHY